MQTWLWMLGVFGAVMPAMAQDSEPSNRRLPEWKARCGNGVGTLGSIVAPVAESMAATRIPYRQDPGMLLADCSGNFLRLSSQVAAQCPGRADDFAILPGVPAWNGKLVDKSLLRVAEWHGPHDLVRTTRFTAEWYQRRGLFQPIFADRKPTEGEAPKALQRRRDWFRPGTVIWYGSGLSKADCKRSECLSDLTGRIRHMGVIVDVQYDEKGDPVSYRLYHGRNKKHGNGITDTHRWDARTPFGNGSQDVLGVAPLVKSRRVRRRSRE